MEWNNLEVGNIVVGDLELLAHNGVYLVEHVIYHMEWQLNSLGKSLSVHIA